MKKVILFLLALSFVVGAQAQMTSSVGGGSFKNGAYNSSNSSLDFSGKISTISTDSQAAVDPSYTTKSKSLLGNLFSKSEETPSVAQQSTKSTKSSSYAPKLNKIYFSWNFTSESDDAFEDWSDTYRLSFTFGYSHATNLFRELIYVDYGLAVTATDLYYDDYDRYYDNDDYSSFNIRTVEVRVPVNVMVNLKLTKKIYFRPYAGFSLGGNMLNDTTNELCAETEGFRFGYQYGAGLNMGKIYLGVERRKLEEVSFVKFNQTSLVLGVTF